MDGVTPIERINVSKILRDMEVGEQKLFGRSFNLVSINSTKRLVNNTYGRDIRIVEVPNGYLAWRKS